MSITTPTILITGAGGFIGQVLAAELLRVKPDVHLLLTDTFSPPKPPSSAEDRMTCVALDLTTPSAHATLFSYSLVAAYTLHGIMSGGSEANLELGLKVNLDSHRSLLDALRASFPGIKVIFPSSIAIFGKNIPPEVPFTENSLPKPQGSYGTQKFMVELLINDYSRRGLIDGRVVRLPTVVVRPGVPSAAASSFASGIVRESLKGIENVLPVDKSEKMWIGSPKYVVRNLIRMLDVPKEKFGETRTVNLPGHTVTVGQILDALEEVSPEARKLVKEERDVDIERLIQNWPTVFDTQFAYSLGLEPEGSLEEAVRDFAASLKTTI